MGLDDRSRLSLIHISETQRKLLREYVDQGGFIFAEACCEGDGFDRDFRQLMKDIFPESPMRLLPYDHPVWLAERKVAPEHLRPLWGVEACCRTSVVYCPTSLSCYWELEPGGRDLGYAAKPTKEIDSVVAIGQNVLAYATNRRLKPKLREPTVTTSTTGELSRNAMIAPKLLHSGGSDDAPNALSLIHICCPAGAFTVPVVLADKPPAGQPPDTLDTI